MSDLEKEIRLMTDKATGWDDRVDGFVKEIVEICEHYGKFFNQSPVNVFRAFEKKRDYSYPNYYQWAKFPKLDGVMVFEDEKEMFEKLKPKLGFRCPACECISKNAYQCDSGAKKSDGKTCDWKSYGFMKAKSNLRFTIKKNWIENPVIDECFRPIALEGK